MNDRDRMLDELFGGGSSPESNEKSQTPSQAIFDFSDPEPEKPEVETGEFNHIFRHQRFYLAKICKCEQINFPRFFFF